jgi:hypothetical protein
MFPSKLVMQYWDIIHMIRTRLPNNYMVFCMINFVAINTLHCCYICVCVCVCVVAFLGQQGFLLVPFWLKACLFIICLVPGKFNIVLQIHNTFTTILHQKDSFPSLFSLPSLTYRGFIGHLLTFHLNPLRVTEISPLW